jgi:hypothetical protein
MGIAFRQRTVGVSSVPYLRQIVNDSKEILHVFPYNNGPAADKPVHTRTVCLADWEPEAEG